MKLSYIVFLLGIPILGYAQQGISVEVQGWTNIRLATTHSGWDAGWNGGGISVGIDKPLKENLQVMVSGELGAAGVSNYLAGLTGVSRPLGLGSSKWIYTPGFHILQGMALSRPHPLYMWGLEQTNKMEFRVKGLSGPGLIIGFRFYGFPGYDRYSEVHSFFDLRAGVSYTF